MELYQFKLLVVQGVLCLKLQDIDYVVFLSQHYVNHRDFKVKELESSIEEVQIIYKNLVQTIRNKYNQLVNEYVVPIHIAREILPNSCLTNIFMTTNFREWRHIISLRQTENNTYEMMNFAQKIKIIFRELIPGIFDDL